MNRRPILLLVLMGCLLMAIPAMATTVGAQTVDDGTTNETNTTTNATVFAVDATLDNETVTVSVTSNDTAVENASVAVNGSNVDSTDANGTLQFPLENRSAVEIGVTVDNTTQTTTYDVVDGSLVERTESTDETADFAFDATLDNETVTVSVTSNGTAVTNASVAVNGTDVGSTDANGTLQFGLDDRPAIELAVTVDGTTRTTTYSVVDGVLVEQTASEDEQIPEEAADQVSTIQRLISAFRNGEFEKLGPIVSEAAGRGPPADVGNGQGNAPANASNGQGNTPATPGNGQGNAPDDAGPPADAGTGQGTPSATPGNGQGNAPDGAGPPADAGPGQGTAPEQADNDTGTPPANAGPGAGTDGDTDRGNSDSDRGEADRGPGNSDRGGNSGGQGNGGSGGNGGGNGQGGGPP